MKRLACVALVFTLASASAARALVVCDDPTGCPDTCRASTSCAAQNATCGTIYNGCMDINCGTCTVGSSCSASNTCVACAPTTSCWAQGMNCGTLWNGCSYQSCGGCAPGSVCNSANVCQGPPPGEHLCNGLRASSAETPSLFDMVCGVGSADGGLAINWLGQWFSIYPDGAGWSLQNAPAGAYALGVAPSDSGDGATDATVMSDDDFDSRTEFFHSHATRTFNWRLRQYSVDVGGRHYDVQIKQNIFDHRVDAYGLQIRGDVIFTISSPDAADGQPWTMVATARHAPLDWSAAAVEPGAEDAEAQGQSAVGTQSTLFGNRNVIYDPNVDLVSAVKTAGYRATELAATAHPALNNAIDQMLSAAGTIYEQHELDAVNHWGNLVGTYGSGIVSFDKQRYAQFFMQTRGTSGFSSPGSDRPLLDTTAKTWSFHQPIVNYTAYWPFLAGVCGLEVDARSFLEGSFQAGTNQCFDGIPTSAYMRGNISFSLSAGGGFGCELLVASASAGMNASLAETFEFGTDVQALPPAVNAYVHLYSSLTFDAFFQTRVLFWTKRWQKAVGKTIVFQRSVNYQMLSGAQGEDLCSQWDANSNDDDDEHDPAESYLSFTNTSCENPTCQNAPKSCAEFGTQTACQGTLEHLPFDGTAAALYYPTTADYVNIMLQNHFGMCAGTFCWWRAWRNGGAGDYHKGMDLWAPHGTAVYAALGGVTWGGHAVEETPSGINLMIRSPFTDGRTNAPIHVVHGYMHLQELLPKFAVAARLGRRVDVYRGEMIGFAGHTGTPTGDPPVPNACHQEHTHFRLYNDAHGGKEDFDPHSWFLKAQPDFVTVANCPAH